MKVVQHRSIILLNIKYPQLSKATVARNQNSIRLDGDKNFGRTQAQKPLYKADGVASVRLVLDQGHTHTLSFCLTHTHTHTHTHSRRVYDSLQLCVC